MIWYSKNQTLELDIGPIPEGVQYSVSWRFGDFSFSEDENYSGDSISIPELNCDYPVENLEVYLCSGGSGEQKVSASIIENGVITEVVWSFDVIISKTPDTLPERLVSYILTPLGVVSFVVSLSLLVGAGYLLTSQISYRRKVREAYEFYQISPREAGLESGRDYTSKDSELYAIPSAHDLSSFSSSSPSQQALDEGILPPPPPPGSY